MGNGFLQLTIYLQNKAKVDSFDQMLGFAIKHVETLIIPAYNLMVLFSRGNEVSRFMLACLKHQKDVRDSLNHVSIPVINSRLLKDEPVDELLPLATGNLRKAII